MSMVHLISGNSRTKTQVSELIYPSVATVLVSSSVDLRMVGTKGPEVLEGLCVVCTYIQAKLRVGAGCRTTLTTV